MFVVKSTVSRRQNNVPLLQAFRNFAAVNAFLSVGVMQHANRPDNSNSNSIIGVR